MALYHIHEVVERTGYLCVIPVEPLGKAMSLAPNAAEILTRHVELELECADRLYLNLYIPILQAPGGITYFWTKHRGYKFASSALMAPMTRAFVEKVEQFVEREGIDINKYAQGKMTYDLRRLRLRGLIERVPKSRRYRVTDLGFRVATLLTRAHARLMTPGLALIEPEPSFPRPLQRVMRHLTTAVHHLWRDAA